MKNKTIVALIIGISVVVATIILSNAYKFKFRAENSIVVTGLGETEFISDLIVWRGWITQQSSNAATGYEQLEKNKQKVYEFIKSKGIADSSMVFMFVNVNRTSEPIYNGGQYIGQRQTGYELRQEFAIESTNVQAVENTSREISSLIAQGVQMESSQPEYYYTKLSDVKLELIEKATQDGKARAEKIADKSGAKLSNLKSAKMGVFQITGANTNEELAAGGSYNSSSKIKKARITVRLDYHTK